MKFIPGITLPIIGSKPLPQISLHIPAVEHPEGLVHLAHEPVIAVEGFSVVV